MPSTKPAAKTAARRQRSSGKTSPASSATAATPSDTSWAHWPAKAVRSNRQGKNGRTQVVCLDPAPHRLALARCSIFRRRPTAPSRVSCGKWWRWRRSRRGTFERPGLRGDSSPGFAPWQDAAGAAGSGAAAAGWYSGYAGLKQPYGKATVTFGFGGATPQDPSTSRPA